MEEEGRKEERKEGVKVRNRVQSCRTHVAEVLKDTGWSVPSLFTRKLLSFETVCVGSANFFLSIEQKQRRLCLRSRGFFCHFRSINYRSIRLSLYSLSFPPSLYFPSSSFFFFFISNVQRTAFVRRERKKTTGTKRERKESFRFVERIASLFSIGRESAGLKWNLGWKDFTGWIVFGRFLYFTFSSPRGSSDGRREIDISRMCARFVVAWSRILMQIHVGSRP